MTWVGLYERPDRAIDLHMEACRSDATGGCRMMHENKLTLREPEDVLDELTSWWRDVAAGSVLAAVGVVAAVMLLL
jgi:hypothetical protein